MKEFRTTLLKFEEKVDALLLENNARGENLWIPTRNTPPPFDSSSMGSTLHGVDWEMKLRKTLVSHRMVRRMLLSVRSSLFKGEGIRPKFPREGLLDHDLDSNLS